MSKKVIILRIILLSFAVFALWSVFDVNLKHFNYAINSDIGGDALSAVAMWKYHSLHPVNWCGSTESRIISVVTVAAFLYGLSHNIQLSMGLACCIVCVVTCLVLFRLYKQLHKSNTSFLVVILLYMLLPSSVHLQTMFYIFMASYSFHLIAAIWVITEYIRLVEGGRPGLSCFLSVIFCASLSLSGMRAILVVCAPLLLLEIMRLIAYELKTHMFPRGMVWTATLYTTVLFVIDYVATLSPWTVGVDVHRNIRNAPAKLIHVVWPEIVECLFPKDGNTACRIIVLILLIVAIAEMIFSATDLYLLFLWISVLTSVFMTTFTTVDVTDRYFFMLYITIATGVSYVIDRIEKNNGYRLMALIFPCLLFCFIVLWTGNWKPIISSHENASEYLEIADYMSDNGIYYGYSTFETSNALTVACNGLVQVSAVSGLDSMEIEWWLTDTNNYVPNLPFEMDTAYIIPRVLTESFSTFLESHKDIIKVHETENYLIFTSEHNYSIVPET